MNKRIAHARTIVGTTKRTMPEAIEALKSLPTVKFTQSLDVVIRINRSPKDKTSIKGTAALPNGLGKNLKLLIFGSPNESQSGATFISEFDKNTLKEIVKKHDLCGATTAGLHVASKAASIIGPLGMMPTAKQGTVMENPEQLIASLSKSVLFAEKSGQIQCSVGRMDMPTQELVENIMTIKQAVTNYAPERRIEAIFISPTMGPAIQVS